MRLHADGAPEWLFCENETNAHRLFGALRAGYSKDAIGRHVVEGEADAVNPDRSGTKCAGRHRLVVPPGGAQSLRLRFRAADAPGDAFADFDAVFAARITEADDFYAAPASVPAEPGQLVRSEPYTTKIPDGAQA